MTVEMGVFNISKRYELPNTFMISEVDSKTVGELKQACINHLVDIDAKSGWYSFFNIKNGNTIGALRFHNRKEIF